MSIVKKDNHKEDITLLLKKNKIEKRGIIHIGAHEGQEVESYLSLGFKKIMLIEANPDLAENLKNNFKSFKEVTVINNAISDSEGTVDFHIHTSRTGSTEPSSLLKMKEFKNIVPSLNTIKTIKVSAISLGKLFEWNYLIQDYNFLNVDVQGAELQVFKGASSILNFFDVIISEVNLIELYEGAPLEHEIVQFLDSFSFVKKKCVYHELYKGENRFKAWGECIFVKTK